MADPTSIYESVDQLRILVDDLRKLLHGDAATRTGGLIAEFDALRSEQQSQRRELHDVRTDLQRLSHRRPIIWLWLLGFGFFSFGMALLVVAGVNAALPTVNWLDLPAGVSFGLSFLFLILSAPMFLAGFGWLVDGR